MFCISDEYFKQGEDLRVANLGDSRAVLGTKRKDGVAAVQLTTDLKPNLPGKYLVSFTMN